AGTTTFRTGQPILIYTPSGGVGGLGSQWYNIGQSRTTRPVIVTPRQSFGSTTDGHAALRGAANFQYYLNPNAFRLPQGFEIGDLLLLVDCGPRESGRTSGQTEAVYARGSVRRTRLCSSSLITGFK